MVVVFSRLRSWADGRTSASGRAVVWTLWIVLAAPLGCSKEKLADMAAAAVQDQAQVVTDQAKTLAESTPLAEVIPATGKAEVLLSPPVTTASAHVRLHVIGDGRPSVLQFTTYDPDKGPETFPALLIRATTDAQSTQGIEGQTLQADVYLQVTSDAEVLTTAGVAQVPLVVAPVDPDAGTLTGRIDSVTLVDADGNRSVASGVTVEGLLP
jgi:hypothetical protein